MSRADDRATVMHALDQLVNGARRDVWKQLAGNGVIALCWLLGSEHRTVGLTNDPAKALFESLPFYPMRVWGFLLLIATALTLLAFVLNQAELLRWSLHLLAAYWVFWAVLYAIAFRNGDGAGVGITFSVLWAMRNRTVGNAAPHIVRRAS